MEQRRIWNSWSILDAGLHGSPLHSLGGSNVTEDTSLKTVTFDNKKLLNMSKDCLEYVDDQGARCAIDFHICRENFQKDSAGWRGARNPKYVGVRDILAMPPHITLATDPPTRFVFPMPGPSVNFTGGESSSLEPPDFHEFQMRLYYEAGVRTVDMT
jgi:hypothetical protein